MLTTSSTTGPANFVAGLTSLLRADGPRGLFRGLTPAMLGVSHGAVQFAFYERLKAARRRARLESGDAGLSSLDVVVTSALAKAAAGISLYPYKVVQARTQNAVGGMGPARVVKELWKAEGVRGFYRG